MRIAAISDIHGNRFALEAVLADIAARGVDVTVNLGDIVSGPLEPAATAELLLPLGLPTVRGNHERQLLQAAVAPLPASDRHASIELEPAHWDWLRTLPKTLWLDPQVLLCHGTPDSDLKYFLHTVEAAGLREASAAEVRSRAGAEPAALIFCGHSHLPRVVQLTDGALVVNPGRSACRRMTTPCRIRIAWRRAARRRAMPSPSVAPAPGLPRSGSSLTTGSAPPPSPARAAAATGTSPSEAGVSTRL